MKLLEKGILLIGALVIVVIGVVLNNYLNSNNYKLYQTDGATSTRGILLNTKTGDAWYLSMSNGKLRKEEYTKPYSGLLFKDIPDANDESSSGKSSYIPDTIKTGILKGLTLKKDKK